MNPKYLLLRLIRRFTPQLVFRYLLKQGLFVQPGIETRAPQVALSDYQALLTKLDHPLQGMRILLFGYGGNFALGCMMLHQGAKHVVLLDKYAYPDDRANSRLLSEHPEFSGYLVKAGSHVLPNQQVMSLLQADIRQLKNKTFIEPFDCILSRSVLEHLDDVDGTVQALAALTKPDGVHVHLIDLSDHYFKYPFEMLTFSERAWQNWLNPPSNLNRLRSQDYRQIFERYFQRVGIVILASNSSAFANARNRIRSEFLTGDAELDAATLISVSASNPRLM